MYNKKYDILYIVKEGRPSKASIEVGDFIIDVDFDGFVSGIEILNASENLNLGKNILKKIKQVSLSILYKPSYLYITIIFEIPKLNQTIHIPLTIDLGHRFVKRETIVVGKK